MINGPDPAFVATRSSPCGSRPFGHQSGVGCAALDAFYAAIPEEFGTSLGDGRHASVAAADPPCPRDKMWLRGIAAANAKLSEELLDAVDAVLDGPASLNASLKRLRAVRAQAGGGA